VTISLARALIDQAVLLFQPNPDKVQAVLHDGHPRLTVRQTDFVPFLVRNLQSAIRRAASLGISLGSSPQSWRAARRLRNDYEESFIQ
jgi:hypothetical protein